MSNVAQDVIIPQKSSIFRTIFLYVGQGEATLLVVPTGKSYQYILIDSNIDKENEGIDLKKMFKDLLGKSALKVFINTHPHTDHIRGLKDIYDEIGISEVWHSGHKPSKEHDDAYKDLEYVINKVGKDNTYQLFGSSEENKLDKEKHPIGDIIYNILSPAEYVVDEIADEKPKDRDKRIHEHCGVIRFTYGSEPTSIMITGDSDLTTWKDHITDYHADRLPSMVLSASHHGSRTFFMENEGDDPYLDHIEGMNPTYVIISAPKKSESKHDHPHDDAIKLYKEYVNEDSLLHLGNQNKKRVSIIVDIDNEGNLSVEVDSNLWDNYKYSNNDDNDKGSKSLLTSSIIIPKTKLDNKEMGH